MAETARTRLSKERIVREALAMVEEGDGGVLTMRALGRRLGVEAMALYYYLPSKDALFDAMVDALTDEVEIPPRGSLAWDESARRISRSYREVALAHPNAFRLLASRPLGARQGTASQLAGLEVLRAAGFDEAGAQLAYLALANYTFGAVLAELTGRSPEFVAGETEAAFEVGLDAVLTGLQARLEESRAG